jgi:serine protease Do
MRFAVAVLLVVFALSASLRASEPDLEKALARARALEEEIMQVVDEVRPTVGAVLNHATIFDAKTGVVRMVPRSLGSGVVISRDGFFLTNVHVVESAGWIMVYFADGKGYPADRYADTSSGQVKGDIAILKLRGKRKWEYADWRAGNVNRLEPGNFVFAMGNPYGHALDGNPVVTMGIISGKGRAASSAGYLYVDVIQTDAEINPGNSGGPLFDSRGRLIGINGLMQSRSGRSNSGVGFAIPMDQIRLFLGKLLRSEGEDIGYGFHGIEVDTAPGESGARIRLVYPGSPAAEAGLRSGDVVLSVNGRRISNRADYLSHATKLPERAVVKMTYLRGNKREHTSYRLGSYQKYLEENGRIKKDQPLPPHERGYLGAHWIEKRGAVVLTRILDNTGAAEAKLQKDDLIVSIDGISVGGVKDLELALAPRAPGETISLVVRRGDRNEKVDLELCDAARAAEKE